MLGWLLRLLNNISPVLVTPLYDTHVSYGGKMIDFSGYMLPVWYSSVKEEHRAVRTGCGVFDISHMGVIRLSGSNAETLLREITCSATGKARRGIMTYSMVLSPSGGILDDIMMGQASDNEWIVIANASNKAKIIDWIRQSNPDHVPVELIATHAMIAVQGPRSAELMGQLLGEEWGEIPRFAIRPIDYAGTPGYIMRSGYTGEDGFELIVPNATAPTLFSAIVQNGATPCGLASRDSLRVEAGLPLYGHELSETLTPLNTRYAWVVDWKGDFIGKSALATQRHAGIPLVTVGIQCENKQIPRQGAVILEGGEVTSGTLPPDGEHSIGLALVPSHLQKIGTPLSIQIRNNIVNAVVAALPFHKK